MSETEKKAYTDEEMLQAVKEGIFRIVSGHQSYTGPSGETYTKANLADLERLEKYYEQKVSAGKNRGGMKALQVRLCR